MTITNCRQGVFLLRQTQYPYFDNRLLRHRSADLPKEAQQITLPKNDEACCDRWSSYCNL
jgi:hypothetical protein